MKMGFNAVFWILVETALSNRKISLLYYPVMCAVDVPDLYFISSSHLCYIEFYCLYLFDFFQKV